MTDNIIGDVYKVSNKERYWLFRAGEKAKYFDLFCSKKQIGMGWDRIDDLNGIDSRDKLKELTKSKYPEDKKPGNISNKIYNFAVGMKKGDIIIMPDIEKKRVAFGKIVDNELDVRKVMEQKRLLYIGNKTDKEKERTDPGIINKFRNVQWLKILPKENLSPKLLLHLFSPHSISKLSNSMRYEVNKLLHDVFVIDNRIYIKYKIDTDSEVCASDMKTFFDVLSYAEKIINIIEDKNEKIVTKTSVCSKGDIVAIIFAGATALSVLGQIFNGGSLKVNFGNFGLEKEGGKTLHDYIEQRHRHKLEKDKIEVLNKLIDKMGQDIPVEKIEAMKKNLEFKAPKTDD